MLTAIHPGFSPESEGRAECEGAAATRLTLE